MNKIKVLAAQLHLLLAGVQQLTPTFLLSENAHS